MISQPLSIQKTAKSNKSTKRGTENTQENRDYRKKIARAGAFTRGKVCFPMGLGREIFANVAESR